MKRWKCSYEGLVMVFDTPTEREARMAFLIHGLFNGVVIELSEAKIDEVILN